MIRVREFMWSLILGHPADLAGDMGGAWYKPSEHKRCKTPAGWYAPFSLLSLPTSSDTFGLVFSTS